MINLNIQGLRGIAVLAVIVFHANNEWLPSGYLGVDLFFMISGYLITGILLKNIDNKRFNLLEFYNKRAIRILPAYALMLIIVSIAASILLIPPDFKEYSNSLVEAFRFTSNFYFSEYGDYFSPKNYELPLLHTWSLSVEMQFYLVYPLALFLIPKRFRIVVLSVLGVIALLIMGLGVEANNFNATYYEPYPRVFQFITGGLFYVCTKQNKFNIPHERKINLMCFVGLILLFIFPFNDNLKIIGFLATVILGGILITSNGLPSQLLSSKTLVFIGGISYSLYLWHWPVFALIRYVNQSEYLTNIQITFSCIFILTVSTISKYLVEDRFKVKECKSLLSFIPRIGSYVFVAVASQSVFASLNDKFTIKLPDEFTRYANLKEICHGQIVKDCLRGDENLKSKPILVIGDSHAAMLNIAFDEYGKAHQKLYKVITASSCVTIPGFDYSALPVWARQPCKDSIAYASKYITDTDTIYIMGMWQYQVTQPNFISNFKNTIEKYFVNKKVVIFLQIPMLSGNPQRIIRFESLGLKPVLNQNNEYIYANDSVKSALQNLSGVYFFEPQNRDLFKQAPYYNGKLIYRDDSHLNEVGSKLYSNLLRD